MLQNHVLFLLDPGLACIKPGCNRIYTGFFNISKTKYNFLFRTLYDYRTSIETNLRFLGAKSTSIRDCVRPSVGRSVGLLVGPSPLMRLRGKLVTLRLLREEEEEEETDYVAIPLRRNSITSRFLRT
jgi:hypothetical protein